MIYPANVDIHGHISLVIIVNGYLLLLFFRFTNYCLNVCTIEELCYTTLEQVIVMLANMHACNRKILITLKFTLSNVILYQLLYCISFCIKELFYPFYG